MDGRPATVVAEGRTMVFEALAVVLLLAAAAAEDEEEAVAEVGCCFDNCGRLPPLATMAT